MKRALENRSLDRGLAVLECLSTSGASSLQGLHASTGLAKSTVRRLLSTLVQRKIVRRSLADGLYRSNIAIPAYGRTSLPNDEGWLVDRALPHMIELTQTIGWACDLHIFERTRSRIIESTRPLSPFFQYQRPIDLQVSVFGSAGGLAVLSTWPETKVLELAKDIGNHPVWGLKRAGLDNASLLAMLRLVRKRGYATRPKDYPGETALAATLNVIACPIVQRDLTVGALALLWPRGYLSTTRFAELHMRQLQGTVEGISGGF